MLDDNNVFRILLILVLYFLREIGDPIPVRICIVFMIGHMETQIWRSIERGEQKEFKVNVQCFSRFL